MSTFKSALLACTVGFAALSGCSHNNVAEAPMTEEQRIAALYALGDTPLKTAAAADENALRAMLESLGESYVVTIGSVTTDAKGDIARDVVIGLKDAEDIKLNISEMRAWGANTDIEAALSAGQSARVAERIEMRGLSILGMEALTQSMMDGYMGAVGDAMAGLDPDAEDEFEALEQDVSKYEFNVEKLVIDGATLYPLSPEAEAYLNRTTSKEVKSRKLLDITPDELEAGVKEGKYVQSLQRVEDAPAQNEFMEMLAMFARWSLGGGADAVSGSGITGEFLLSQSVAGELDQDMDMTFSIDNFAYADAHRGDVGLMVMDDLSYDLNMMMGESEADMSEFMSQTLTYERYIGEDWRLTKLFEHLSRGEVPSMDVKDLMSLGRFRVIGETVTLNGQPYYSIEQSEFDMSEWSWFIPNTIDMSIKGGMFHTTAFTSFFEDIFEISIASEEMTDDELAEAELVIDVVSKFGEALTANDMSAINFNFDMAADWNPETGAFEFDYDAEGVDLMHEVFDFSLVMPTYRDFRSIAPDDGESMDLEALQNLFMDKTKFEGFTLMLDDDGLIGKVFSLVHDGAALVPEEHVDDNVRMLQNTEPKQLRETAQGLIRMAGFAANDSFPPAVKWANSFADFVQKGGVFEFAMSPDSPFGAAEFETEMQAIEEDPAYLVDLLGITVEHTPDEVSETAQ